MIRTRTSVKASSSLSKLAVIAFVAATSVCCFAQNGPAAKPDEKAAAPDAKSAPPASEATINGFAFDVVAVKPFQQKDGGMSMMTRFTPNGVTAQGPSLHMLIRMAYGLEDNQILNEPAWLGSDSFEVDAKMDEETTAAFNKLNGKDQMKAREHMMQGMLADRFKLGSHKETRDLPIFNLVVAKGGPKFKEAKEGDTYPNGMKGPDGHGGGGMIMVGPDTLTMQGGEVKSMVSILSDQLGHHVIDKTGLTGKYDVSLKWAPQDRQGLEMKGAANSGGESGGAAPAEASGPSIFAALQEQLGLKLESAKAPVEVLVIDHAEQPSAN
jgi:uncharacterized protein (TIGR03435 family)